MHALVSTTAPLPSRPTQTHEIALALEAGGWQPLAVSGRIVERYLITLSAPARKLAPLAPPPLEVDAFRGYGFVSVCALEVRGMGICGLPSFLRFDNREFLYRVGVRFRGEPTFLTLRSDVSARPLAWLGRRFSHYRPHLARIALSRDHGFRLACSSADGQGDALLEVDPPDPDFRPDGLFPSARAAADFLLGMRTSVDRRPDGRVQLQPIDHDPWGAAFARVRAMRFAFLERLAATIGEPLRYDHALVVRNVRQTWRATRWA